MSERCEPPEHLRGVDGWHWVQCMNGPEPDSYAPELVFWYAPNSTSRYSGLAGWDDSDLAEPEAGYRYHSPVATPAEVEALRAERDTAISELATLRARVEALEGALRKIATENTKYTTGEGHSDAIWIARAALEDRT